MRARDSRWPRRAVAGLLVAAGFLLALAGAAAAQGGSAPSSSPLEQARQTDEMLRRLSAAGPFVPRGAAGVTTSTRAASTGTSSTTAPLGLRPPAATLKPLVKGRITTATVILRRNRSLSLLAAPARAALPTSPALPASPPIPAVPLAAALHTSHPALLAALARQSSAAPLTSAGQRAAIPAVNPAWLGNGNKTRPVVSKVATAAGATSATAAAATVRVNFADAADLRARLGIDGTRARNIVEFRALYGPFKIPEDLAQVNGISEDMARKWDERNLLLFN